MYEAWPIVHVEKDAAEAKLRAVAFTSEDDGRTTVHSYVGTSVLPFIGADWDLDKALAFVAAADEITWTTHPIQHDLAVRGAGRVVCFDVARPERAAPLDYEHVSPMVATSKAIRGVIEQYAVGPYHGELRAVPTDALGEITQIVEAFALDLRDELGRREELAGG